MQAVLGCAEATRREPGALGCYVSEDLEVSGAFSIVSEWQSQADLEVHIAGQTFGVLLGALDLLAARTKFEVAQSGAGTDDATALVRRIREGARRLEVSRSSRGGGGA